MADSDADYTRGEMNIAEQKNTYDAVMRFTGFWGIPGTLALTAFFTSLVTGGGFMALAWFVLVFILVHLGFRLFFK